LNSAQAPLEAALPSVTSRRFTLSISPQGAGNKSPARFKNAENTPVCAEYFGLMAPSDPQAAAQGFAHFTRMANW